MTSENFVYWLQGYFELLNENGQEITLTQKQIKCIEDHLGYVFEHQNTVKDPLDLKESKTEEDRKNQYLAEEIVKALEELSKPRTMAPEFDLSDIADTLYPGRRGAKIC